MHPSATPHACSEEATKQLHTCIHCMSLQLLHCAECNRACALPQHCDVKLVVGKATVPLARLFWKSASIAASSGKASTPGRGATPACMVLGRVDKENAEGLADSTKGPLMVPALEGLGLTSRLGLTSPRGGERLPLFGLLFLLDLRSHTEARKCSEESDVSVGIVPIHPDKGRSCKECFASSTCSTLHQLETT